MTTREAAQYLGISPFYLRNMRHLLHTHDGPSYTMREGGPGGIYYDYAQADLDLWLTTHTFRPSKKEEPNL